MHLTRALALSAAVATATAGLVAPAVTAQAATPTAGRVASDVREIKPGTTYQLGGDVARAAQQRASGGPSSQSLTAAGTPALGTVRPWLALDDARGKLYLKDYTLTAVGAKIEVWVASGSDTTSQGTAFPTGDCRNNTPDSTTITKAQAQSLASEFDSNIYPKESKAFSVAPDRDGSKAQLAGDYSGGADKIVTLVDNVRDANFYDFAANPTYIAGFFSSQFNSLVDRNVMTIDAFDWKHRTGVNPPDQPTADPCSSRPARPRLYEGVFAHEYQHLLESYQDPAEVNFVNEGLSDFAISLTGYGKPEKTVTQRGTESHIACFQGFGPVATAYNSGRDCGGPQNSLTLWGDEGSGSEILADYGNAWSFQLFLFDRYGQPFISALHRDGKQQGLAGVQAQLDVFAKGTKVVDVLHDFQAMNLVDRYVGGTAGGTVTGVGKGAITTKSLNATVNLLNPTAYAKPGAAPNGADYVGLRGNGAGFLRGGQLKDVTFSGATTLAPLPLLWTSVSDAPGRTGNPTLWSGNSTNLDSAAVTPVAVPAGSPTLTFTEKHLAELGYDYAYTVVSTDGGKTYTPLANANTVAGPLGPALNGDSADFATQTFDLTPYAGKTVLLGFRYVSDGGVNDGGWYVDDVKVGSTAISDGSSLAPFKSPTQVRATQVANWHVQLIGLDQAGHRAHVSSFDGRTSFTLSADKLAQFDGYPLVVAVVAYDEPTEQVQQYASYALTVNGVLQPGG